MADAKYKRHADICEALGTLRQKYGPTQISSRDADSASIVAALHQFQECVRYLNTRRSAGAVLNLETEADVQDALYLMLRPWVHDLIPEDPTGKIANSYSIKDFCSRSARTVIEAKFVRDTAHGKTISREMHDDIETYRHHNYCDTLVFFVYDPNCLIPDQQQLKDQIEEERFYKQSGRTLRCVLIVKP